MSARTEVSIFPEAGSRPEGRSYSGAGIVDAAHQPDSVADARAIRKRPPVWQHQPFGIQ
jgi:hypothetical protein